MVFSKVVLALGHLRDILTLRLHGIKSLKELAAAPVRTASKQMACIVLILNCWSCQFRINTREAKLFLAVLTGAMAGSSEG